MDELWDHLIELIQRLGNVYCIIDGLDECEEVELLSFVPLLAALNNHSSVAHLLITSRKIPAITSRLFIPHTCFNQLRIGAMDVNDDLNLFIRHGIQKSQRLQLLDAGLKTKVTDTLLAQADGMFIYAKFILSDLEAQPHARGIEQTLQSLPSDLSEVYQRTFKRLESTNKTSSQRELAGLVFNFALFGMRPLQVAEISEATQLEVGKLGLQKELDFDIGGRGKDEIERVCAPFLEVVEYEIRIVHHSVREFLLHKASETTFLIPIHKAHSTLLNLCIHYLMLDVFKLPLNKERFHVLPADDLNKLHPFLAYAAPNWSSHLSAALRQSDTLGTLDNVIRDYLMSSGCLTWAESVLVLSSIAEFEPILANIEQWLSISAAGNNTPLGLQSWVSHLRRSCFDWAETISADPGGVHYIHQFIPLPDPDLHNKQSLLRAPEELQRKIFPRVSSMLYTRMIRQDDMIVLWDHKVSGSAGEDCVIAAIFNWYTGSLVLSLSCTIPETPSRHSVLIRSIVLSEDGKHIAAALHRELDIDADDDVNDNEPYMITTYVWSVEERERKPLWTKVSRPLNCFDYSCLALSFPGDNHICCPSGVMEVATGELVVPLDALLADSTCVSMSFSKSTAALVRSDGQLETWKLQMSSFVRTHSFGLSKLFGVESSDEALYPCSIRDISQSSRLVAVWDLGGSISLLDIDAGTFKPRAINPVPDELWFRISLDEQKLGFLGVGFDGEHYHGLLYFDVKSLSFQQIFSYQSAKPPTYITFEPGNSNCLLCCYEQKGPTSWISVVESVDLQSIEPGSNSKFSPNDYMRFQFCFSGDGTTLHVAKVPEPEQPICIGLSGEL